MGPGGQHRAEYVTGVGVLKRSYKYGSPQREIANEWEGQQTSPMNEIVKGVE